MDSLFICFLKVDILYQQELKTVSYTSYYSNAYVFAYFAQIILLLQVMGVPRAAYLRVEKVGSPPSCPLLQWGLTNDYNPVTVMKELGGGGVRCL